MEFVRPKFGAEDTMTTLKPRNAFACDPIMRKGGAHRKSTKAERAAQKRRVRREVDNDLSKGGHS
ncbi:MAG: hypothetical protein AMS22_16090 [Thiotrichales bacterium SG8_50]|nr:MAG: hypothetical protein AMS22_16090 [Thiotrichales bacterium SG8_50]